MASYTTDSTEHSVSYYSYSMLYFLLVIYNVKICESPAFISLKKAYEFFSDNGCDRDCRFLVIDNSDQPSFCAENKESTRKSGAEYLSMNGNQGLPAAYMRGIQYALDHGAEWVLISDQDSVFDRQYLQVFFNHLCSGQEKLIYAPEVKEVKAQKRISPIVRRNRQYYINSGIAVNRKVFAKAGYDKNLFLDYVDYDFFNSCYALGIGSRIQFVPSMKVSQNFSGAGKNGLEKDLKRFQIYVRDGRYFYSKWHKRTWDMEMVIRCLHLCFMYHSFRFLGVLLKNAE